jgi:hypothetical protein
MEAVHMSIDGRVAIDVDFSDVNTGSGVQSVKKITLTDTTSYTTGKVAVVTGTVGTAVTSVAIAPTDYRNAAGDIVSFSSVSRVAFAASGANLVRCYGNSDTQGQFALYSRIGQVSVSEAFETQAGFEVRVIGTAGTAAYTLVLYGA